MLGSGIDTKHNRQLAANQLAQRMAVVQGIGQITLLKLAIRVDPSRSV